MTLTLGRCYAVATRDRHTLPYLEIGRGERVVRCSDGTRSVISNGLSPNLRLTCGWSVGPHLRVSTFSREQVSLSFWRLTLEINMGTLLTPAAP